TGAGKALAGAVQQRSAPPPSGQLAPGRNEHPDLSAVALVLLAEQLDEVALLQEDPDEDVRGRHGCEQEMPDRHHASRPERDDEAEIDRMPHQLVEHWRLEARLGHPTPARLIATWCSPNSSK